LTSIYRIVIIDIQAQVDPIPNSTFTEITKIPSQFSSENSIFSVISTGASHYKFLLLKLSGTSLKVYNYTGQTIEYLYGQLCYIK
jgi:hypothetical protein